MKKEILTQLVAQYESPARIALSRRFPILKRPIISTRRALRILYHVLHPKIRRRISDTFFTHVVARHQSLLRRKLGTSDPRLQEQKIQNLAQAVKRLNGVVIQPGEIFSLWHIVGKPSYKKGYVDGMLLSNGQVVEGLGGGLCQLSNFLCWIFLHAPIEIVERYHHSKDVFPDSGRVLPFGSGATILYNFVDLKVKNTSDVPLQLKIWLTDNHLKGQIVSSKPVFSKFHVYEKEHFFVKKQDAYFRYNEIYRDEKIEGILQGTAKLFTNFAPVLYDIDQGYIEKNNLRLIEL
ncbi:VanW family protein [Patescibacteria group bacterium]|nr:VanW family protein [Patescibacteria group bacterium]MBU1721391.1 VanW family protein [Patescibacteria group bacterium]MBU1901831.1 VanW family protein [Patescibacteria group bacterium]